MNRRIFVASVVQLVAALPVVRGLFKPKSDQRGERVIATICQGGGPDEWHAYGPDGKELGGETPQEKIEAWVNDFPYPQEFPTDGAAVEILSQLHGGALFAHLLRAHMVQEDGTNKITAETLDSFEIWYDADKEPGIIRFHAISDKISYPKPTEDLK